MEFFKELNPYRAMLNAVEHAVCPAVVADSPSGTPKTPGCQRLAQKLAARRHRLGLGRRLRHRDDTRHLRRRLLPASNLHTKLHRRRCTTSTK